MPENYYYFVCNPAANTGRLKKKWVKIQETIEQYISKDQYEYVFTDAPLHAVDLAKESLKNGFTHIISVGGDGIANEVTNGLMSSGASKLPVFGMIPAGTSNDAHQTKHFPNNALDAVPIIFEDNVEKFPIGKATGDFGEYPHYFLDHCDVGLAALAARMGKYALTVFKGEWKYTLFALYQLTKFKTNPGKVTVDGEVYEGDFALAGVGFGDYMSGYNLWPGNNIRMGNFGVLMARGQSRIGLLKLMFAAEKGKHIGKEGVDYLRGKVVEIDLERPWPYQAEGEIFTENSRQMKFEYVPDAMSMLTAKVDE